MVPASNPKPDNDSDFVPKLLTRNTRTDPIWRVGRPREKPACNCWFRKLGKIVKPEVPLQVVPDADPDALDSAKRNAESLYQPLKPWQTRIVTISSAHPSEPLRCNLWTAELIDKPGVAVSGTSEIVAYKALSYSWGLDHSALAKLITCNDMPVLVNSRLAAALLDLRQQQEDVRIWCDALCINQSDPVEKAQQVRNMLRIFEKAELVIAWIGLPDWRTKHLFKALKDNEDGLGHRLHSPDAMRTGISGLHDRECFEAATHLITAARKHLGRPWFRRTWVRQEVFGTNNLVIYCSGHTISLTDLVTTTQLILKSFQQIPPAMQGAPDAQSLSQRYELGDASPVVPEVPASVSVLQNSYQHAGTDSHDYQPPRQRLRYSAHWLRVLNEGAEFEVTDPRDKVYGVLGIITSPTTKLYVESRPDIQRAEFPISYTKSVSEVYQDVVKHLINLDQNLDVLEIFEDRRHRAKDLPSWVTDWRQSTKRSAIQCPPDEKSERESLGQAPIQNLEDVGKLELDGVQLGGPLKGINVRSKGDLEIVSPGAQRMDSSYLEVIVSDSFVWGTFWFDKNLLTGNPKSQADPKGWVSKMQEKKSANPRNPAMEGPIESRILIPREAKLDDILVALLGSSCLFLLRPLPHNEYEFLGPVIRSVGDLPDWSRIMTQTFVLV